MKKKQFKVRTYYEAVECECGGAFLERVSGATYLSYPEQADFKCDNCGRVECLFAEDWPGLRYEIIKEKR